NQHYDKRPSNALITAAAELCRDRGISYLVYGKYTYGNKTNSPLTEFKRRTGFEKVSVPRYYVPMTRRGNLYILSGLHRGWIGILPSGMIRVLLGIRAKLVEHIWVPLKASKQFQSPSPAQIEG